MSANHSPALPLAAKKTTIITAAAKKRLRDYFIAAQWSLNRNLDTGQKFLVSDVGRIASELGLKRTQVSRQLLRYKEEKYGNTQIKLILDGNQLEEKMWQGLSMTSIEFITTSLERIYKKDSSSCRDFLNFPRQLNDFPPAARTIVTHIAGTPDDDGCKLLSSLTEY